MKKTRFLTAVLAALMLVGTATACANSDNSADTDTAQTDTSANENWLEDSLPKDLNFKKEKITFISDDQIMSEKLSGDPVSDILYERNKAVEQRLGIEIDCINDADCVNKIITSINGGSADYDILVSYCWTTAPRFADAYFADLRQTEYLDFQKPWWNQSFNHAVSYNDAQYGITGDITLSLYRRTYATVFNKKLFTDARQAFLYDHVEDGSWTLDKQASLVPLLHKDNGNQIQDKTGDIYGFVSSDFIHVDPYWAACEIDIITKNNDGEYEWVFDSEKMYDMAEKVLHLYYATDDGSYIEKDNFASEETILTMFSSSYAAMATICIEQLEGAQMRNMTDEYGVVPIPKFLESQTTYHSQMHDGFRIACIPTTVQGERLDMMSAVLEALSSTSYNLVRPVYYETTLRTKLAQDPQSAEMMDLIINNIHIDPGFVYSHAMAGTSGGFHQEFQTLVESGTNDTMSRFKSSSKQAKKNWDDFLSKLDKLASQS